MNTAVVSVGETMLSVTDIGPMMRAPVKDKTYRKFPVGMEAAKFLRAKRWAGGSEATDEAYEGVVAKLALDFIDFPGLHGFCTPVGREYLEDFLDRHWGGKEPATKGQRASIIRSLFAWATDQGICPYNPAAKIKVPRVKNRDRLPHNRETMQQLLARQDTLRDEIALSLLARLGLRKNELRVCRIQDFDLARGRLLVHGKGGKDKLIPLVYTDLCEALYLHVQGERRHPDEYLLYPRSRRFEPMDGSSVHRWFKRCLDRAWLPASIEMHECRHFAADELWRTTGNLVLAQQLLRHESVGTTQRYLHPSLEDLAAGMRLVEAEWQR